MQRHDLIEQHFKLQELQKKALKKIGLKTIEDLLYHFPTRYGDTAEMKNIGSLVMGENAVIFGRVSGLKTGKAFIKKTPIAEGYIEDETGKIKAVWFHQPYIAKMIQEGALVRVEGKVSERKNILGLVNPKIETVGKLPIGVGDSLFGEDGEVHSLYPVYPESRGITSLWIYHAIQKVLKSGILDNLSDAIPDYILKTYNLPSLTTALVWIHAPLKQDDALSARKRFAFEEVFLIQLQKKRDRIVWQKEPAFVIEKTPNEVEQFVKRFPFQATEAQQKAINSIMSDFKKGQAMSRLLEGDVGSGKTAVAATTAYSVITSRPKGQDFGHLQVAYMAPTEILAKQHFESFIQYFTYLNINIGLITGKECRKFPSKTNPKEWTNISRPQLLKWVENGEIPILIGTHALIQKNVKFKHLAYVIIDEQHRFGTAQRQKLAKKEKFNPHLLSMTATPIPRTLALTIYGDLDLTLLDQMPSGRKPIITEIVLPGERENTYEKIKQELKAGRQLYVICPRIDEPDPTKEQAVIAKSVMEEAERLERDVFPEYKDRIGILHSKMPPDDKEYVMEEFKKGNIKILVATSVVEVGVNVPNATVIIIEGAERFGLAQLHQLRGRVIRSNDQAYCYVFADSKTQKTVERLKAFKNSSNGFELAEFDLKLRGPGELSGNKQWGISDIGMEALKNIKMVEAARAEAEYLLSQDETLTKYPLLNTKLTLRKQDELHLE
ncbi:MAG: ATP-dependent DNA helicase RecG [Candidatus Paceibacterota bacterium]